MSLDYCNNNDLVLNEEKTKHLIFGTKKNEVAVIVDVDLSWKNHVDILCKKTQQFIVCYEENCCYWYSKDCKSCLPRPFRDPYDLWKHLMRRLVLLESRLEALDSGEGHNALKVLVLWIEYSDQEVDTKDKIVLLGCEDGSVHCIAIFSRKTLFSFSCKSPVNTLAFITDSHFVVGCQNGEILLYNVDNPNVPVQSWYESNSAVLCVVRHGDGGHLSSHADGSVVFRHVRHPDKRVVLTGPNCDPVYQLCAEQQFVYTCSRDALIRRYTVERVVSVGGRGERKDQGQASPYLDKIKALAPSRPICRRKKLTFFLKIEIEVDSNNLK
ncbi:Proteasomal ATPase-associated factor 1 [Homalodisca vitripennis]|nr:Proteasomal ATPase-associated factor 1 [Homalodisca vitripennis]